MINKTITDLFWHYTTKIHLEKIINDKQINFAVVICKKEVPVVWFSTNQKWETSAEKIYNGENLSFDDQYDSRLRKDWN